MANEIKGRIHVIMPTETIKGNTGNYLKRTIVLDCTRYDQQSGQRYPNFPSLEFSGENCAKLDSYRQGDLVTIEFSLRGREYQARDGQTKYFTNVSAYKITGEQQAQRPPQQQPMTPQQVFPQQQPPQQYDGESLPF